MISSVLALMLLAAPSPQAVATARKEYSHCLKAYYEKALKDRPAVEAFESGLGAACAAKEQAIRSVVVAVDTAAGVKRAAAEEGATFEVQDMVTNTKELFRDAASAAAKPDS